MMENLKMIKEKEKGYIIIITGIGMKENGKMIKEMEMELCIIIMMIGKWGIMWKEKKKECMLHCMPMAKLLLECIYNFTIFFVGNSIFFKFLLVFSQLKYL